jgi:uncharacterized protein YbbK (DUF523 family)
MVKLLVSACMMGRKVRYNGNDLAVEAQIFADILSQVEAIPFCPEVSGGLPTPRAPAEISDGNGTHVLNAQSRVISNDGGDVTDAFITGARLALATCQQQHIQLALLTESSPSCGSTTVYNGKFGGVKIPGKGVTTALLEQHGIKVFSQYQLDELMQEIRRSGHNS